ncbi:MAG: DUF2165 family protein [Beijerinckiaceae bacterium]
MIGGEYFALWQSKTWNGRDSAARCMLLDGVVLLVLLVPERRAEGLLGLPLCARFGHYDDNREGERPPIMAAPFRHLGCWGIPLDFRMTRRSIFFALTSPHN